MDGTVNKLLAGLAVGFAVMGSGCSTTDNRDLVIASCCTSVVLVFERTGGPDLDPAPWTLGLGSIGSMTTCVFGAAGWQCDNPDFVGVPPPPGTRGTPRSTELRVRMSVDAVGATTGIEIFPYRGVQRLPGRIRAEGVPVCATDEDAAQVVVVLPPPVTEPGT